MLQYWQEKIHVDLLFQLTLTCLPELWSPTLMPCLTSFYHAVQQTHLKKTIKITWVFQDIKTTTKMAWQVTTWFVQIFGSKILILNKIRPKQKKTFTYKALTCCSFKKNTPQDLFTIFQDFTSILQTFSRSEQISRLFQELKTLYEPCYHQKWLEKCWPAHTVPKADIHDLGMVVK